MTEIKDKKTQQLMGPNKVDILIYADDITCSFLISITGYNNNSSKTLVRIVEEVQVEAAAIFVLQVLHLY